MGRARRVYYQNAVYHVYNRGNNHRNILASEIDKTEFLQVLGRYQERLKFKIYGIVLMSNHYHMMIETDEVNNLSKLMHAVALVYGRKYGRRHKYKGHLWQSRYKSRVIENERYAIECLEYIHQNPVKAGLAETAAEYVWSSVKKYEIDCAEKIERFVKLVKFGDRYEVS